ncbi:uncharacterized protein YALI1_D09142g [Yarrowia lipolytica]|uniref:Uncharacterized protein n=1 Tax=Yarrowia lipolytica TaxID=4952 RepID=A0A1D8NDK7_YARLL|nr:hypothetical protein YALI1_D09142g [Yarrowia lipolytica]
MYYVLYMISVGLGDHYLSAPPNTTSTRPALHLLYHTLDDTNKTTDKKNKPHDKVTLPDRHRHRQPTSAQTQSTYDIHPPNHQH